MKCAGYLKVSEASLNIPGQNSSLNYAMKFLFECSKVYKTFLKIESNEERKGGYASFVGHAFATSLWLMIIVCVFSGSGQ